LMAGMLYLFVDESEDGTRSPSPLGSRLGNRVKEEPCAPKRAGFLFFYGTSPATLSPVNKHGQVWLRLGANKLRHLRNLLQLPLRREVDGGAQSWLATEIGERHLPTRGLP
jgi:hypothetical protein